MKTVIYYFSGTGNTLMLARLLAKELGDTEIINIAGIKEPFQIPEADRVGIMYPVYAFGMPRMMCDFVKERFSVNADTYVFALANYASAGGPVSLKLLKAILKDKDIKLNAGYGLAMPSNYIPFGGAESQEKQNKKFVKAAEGIKNIAGKIEKAPENYFPKKSFVPLFFAKTCNKFFIKDCPKDVAKFYANDKCTSCGTCVKICPTHNIKLVDKRPVWGDNCEQCMACLQWCPEIAIHRKGVSENRSHYHNPTVEVEDLIKAIGE